MIDIREFSNYEQMRAHHEAEISNFFAKNATMNSIVRTMSEDAGIPVEYIRGPSHKRHLALKRFPMWKVLHKQGYSLAQIGRYFGGRHHTTILHGIRRADEIKEQEDELK